MPLSRDLQQLWSEVMNEDPGRAGWSRGRYLPVRGPNTQTSREPLEILRLRVTDPIPSHSFALFICTKRIEKEKSEREREGGGREGKRKRCNGDLVGLSSALVVAIVQSARGPQTPALFFPAREHVPSTCCRYPSRALPVALFAPRESVSPNRLDLRRAFYRFLPISRLGLDPDIGAPRGIY